MKHKNKFNDMFRKFGALVLAFTFMAIHTITAQTSFNLENFLYIYNPDYPNAHMTEGHYQEVTIPSTTGASYLYLEVKGADGGHHKTHGGGKGAITKGMFEIGTGTNQIPPGSTLRMIQGQHGRNYYSNSGRGSAGGGGGGSAVILLPSGKTSWDNDGIVLMVAGGGGGAGQNQEGRPGNTAETGTAGTDADGNGINNGGGKNLPGSSTDDASGGASMDKNALFGNASCNSEISNPAGAQKGWPKGGLGCECICWGGFGFGAGGSGNTAGGGGGGYSGGGGGYYKSDNGSAGCGGGGGSHVTTRFNIINKSIVGNGVTFSPTNGSITYGLLGAKSIKFAYNTYKCIDDSGSNTNNGTNILSNTCTGNANQQWFINFTARSIRSSINFDKCLDLSNSNTSNGSNIQLWDCNGSNAQKWVYNGLYKTIHTGAWSDKCLDAANGSATPPSNVNIQLWDCIYTNLNQKWNIDGATTVSKPQNARFIIPVLAPNVAVASALGNVWGSNIQLWTKDASLSSENWYFDGLYIKLRDHQEFCIDLNSSNTDNGNNIQLWGCNGTDAQKWLYDGMTQAFRSVINPDKCMQIELNADPAYGKRSNIDIQDCNGSAAQQFLIQE